MAGLQPLSPLWEMSEKELGWLEGLRFSLSAELPVWRGGGPWRLRYEDAVGDGDRDLTRVVREEVSFDEIAAVDLDRMAVQLCSEVEDSPSPAELHLTTLSLTHAEYRLMTTALRTYGQDFFSEEGVAKVHALAEILPERTAAIDPLIKSAWLLLTTAYDVNWAGATEAWKAAAADWRDEYHKRLDSVLLSFVEPDITDVRASATFVGEGEDEVNLTMFPGLEDAYIAASTQRDRYKATLVQIATEAARPWNLARNALNGPA